MKGLVILVLLGGLVYGGKWLYDNHYLDSFLDSVSKTTERTANFATDKAVKDTNFDGQSNAY